MVLVAFNVAYAALVVGPALAAGATGGLPLAGISAPLAASVLVGIVGLVDYFEYHGIGPQDGIVRRGPNARCAALTFDDGPSPLYTPQILDVLAAAGVKATFFVVGEHVRAYPDVARRIVAEGHDMGNHTATHRDLVPASRLTVEDQLDACDVAIEEVIGARPLLFRPPRGIYGNRIRLLALSRGYRTILWSVSSIDWRGKSAQAIARRVHRCVRPGAIILFHDSGALIRREGASRQNTVDALPHVIHHLREERGYEIIPVSEMLRRLDAGPLRTTLATATEEASQCSKS